MRIRAFALLFILVGCGGVQDPASAPRAIAPVVLEPPPVYSLLGYRQEIGLTSEQVTALDSIAEGVRRENAPLVQRLRERNPASAQQRGFILIDTVARPVLEQVRQNNREAAAAVGEVLTTEQRASACRMFEQQQRERMTRRGSQAEDARARQQQQGRGAIRVEPSDTAVVRGAVWGWCSPATLTSPAAPGEVQMDTLSAN
ncbi:hypothetical protein BH23GEM6_BH23GEM6_01990 [soil metagenome]